MPKDAHQGLTASRQSCGCPNRERLRQGPDSNQSPQGPIGITIGPTGPGPSHRGKTWKNGNPMGIPVIPSSQGPPKTLWENHPSPKHLPLGPNRSTWEPMVGNPTPVFDLTQNTLSPSPGIPISSSADPWFIDSYQIHPVWQQDWAPHEGI